MNPLTEQIQNALTAQEVAERYGFTPNRAGFISCPFHSGDHSPSLKLYPENRGWHCFGCGKGGGVIYFVMLLFDIDYKQAVVRLNSDFNLGLHGFRMDARARSEILEARKREAELKAKAEAEYQQKAAEYRKWFQIAKDAEPTGPDDLNDLYFEAMKKLPELEDWLEKH